MPRTLPWLVQAAKKPAPKQSSSSSPAPKRKRAFSPDDDLVDSDLNTTRVVTPQQRERKAKARSPSTSPPLAPPDIEYMREGYTADDIWMMVEDEFHSTAQAFTQHIHHAEYVRLKKLATSRGPDTLQTIARPTDGRTAQSNGTKLRFEAEAKARQAKNGFKGMRVGDESEDEDEYMLDPQLAGLMTGSQRGAQDLTGLAKARSNIRAAAGFSKSPQKARSKYQHHAEVASKGVASRWPGSESDQSDDDDLNGATGMRPVAKPKLPVPRQQHDRGGRNTLSGKTTSQPEASGFFKRFTGGSEDGKRVKTTGDPQASRNSMTSAQDVSHKSKPTPATVNDREDDSPFLSNVGNQATSDFLAKRRAREAARQKGKGPNETLKTRSTVDVPTFIL